MIKSFASKETEKIWNGVVSRKLPTDIQRIARRRLVPALLRTIDNVQLTDKDIENLMEDIQGRKNIKDGSS